MSDRIKAAAPLERRSDRYIVCRPSLRNPFGTILFRRAAIRRERILKHAPELAAVDDKICVAFSAPIVVVFILIVNSGSAYQPICRHAQDRGVSLEFRLIPVCLIFDSDFASLG